LAQAVVDQQHAGRLTIAMRASLARSGKSIGLWLSLAQALSIMVVLGACAPPPPLEIAVTLQRPIAVMPPTATPARPAIPLLPTPTPQCSLQDLPVGQHISSTCSYSQTETESAGPMLCRIERNSCAYSNLVVNRDDRMVFNTHKPPPLTDEDAMMHPAMLLPLSRLADMVQAEWGTEVKLLVTAAYDSIGEHDLLQNDPERKYSLHFEGRSIDLVTYPSDQAKLPRLCALALFAGFDWVHDEADHCHASIKATSLCSVCSGAAP
jgi:hypothetical protein